MARKRQVLKATLLIVGEGAHEKAFLQYLKSLYDHRESGQTIKVDAASGGSPIEIIDDTIRKNNHAEYDRKVILLDTDVVIKQQDRDKARKHKIELIESTPICLDGMLLDLLGHNISATSSATDCKHRLHALLNGDPTSIASYSALFPINILNATTKPQIQRLISLLKNE